MGVTPHGHVTYCTKVEGTGGRTYFGSWAELGNVYLGFLLCNGVDLNDVLYFSCEALCYLVNYFKIRTLYPFNLILYVTSNL